MILRGAALALALLVPQIAGAQEVAIGTGAVLRGLDKLNGTAIDMQLATGESAELGKLQVTLRECRYPAGDAAGDAYAFLSIRDAAVDTPVFEGWMIASSPALSAMEHPRYDVWVLRCNTE
ncbi:MAG: DUF2155 domain-containing protein [Roseovarius pacificus]|nr:DUF2155 domain-containing protein [Roseovarius pacificus]